jgi:hypothetical protein
MSRKESDSSPKGHDYSDTLLVLLSHVFADSWRLWICYFADSASAERRMAGTMEPLDQQHHFVGRVAEVAEDLLDRIWMRRRLVRVSAVDPFQAVGRSWAKGLIEAPAKLLLEAIAARARWLAVILGLMTASLTCRCVRRPLADRCEGIIPRSARLLQGSHVEINSTDRTAC